MKSFVEYLGSTVLGAKRGRIAHPLFAPALGAFYYVWVLEIPTPRWSTTDAVKLGMAPPDTVPATIQERA